MSHCNCTPCTFYNLIFFIIYIYFLVFNIACYNTQGKPEEEQGRKIMIIYIQQFDGVTFDVGLIGDVLLIKKTPFPQGLLVLCLDVM